MRRTFIDSGVLIAAATGNDEVSAKALNALNDPECAFVTSDFVRLEVLPKALHYGNINEVAFYEAFFDSAIAFVDISQALVMNAHTEARTHGLSAVDALHVSAAKLLDSDEIITTEKHTKPMFRVTGLAIITINS